MADRGRGLPEGKEEKIFQRFYTERPSDESLANIPGWDCLSPGRLPTRMGALERPIEQMVARYLRFVCHWLQRPNFAIIYGMKFPSSEHAKSTTDHEVQNTMIAPVQLVIVIGQSGSGHSTALNILEDAGFSAVDNLPLALMDQLVALSVETENTKLAIGVDLRTSGFDPVTIIQLVTNLKSFMQDRCQVVLIKASTEELLRRYKTTRRRHPLSEQADSLEEAIEKDRLSMTSIAHLADINIDSTGRAPEEFRRALLSRLELRDQYLTLLTIHSFSYKKGLPESSDYVFDMRFLKNPHWQYDLSEKTGLDEDVRSFVEADPLFSSFMRRVTSLIGDTLPSQTGDGRPHITVAFGCTGGKHRSVVSAQWFARWAEARALPISVFHRELR